MFSIVKFFNLLTVYLLPNTKQAEGYKISIWGGVFAAGWIWIISLISFFYVEMPSRDLEGFLFLMNNFGFGFYVLISALFWMILTFTFHSFPKTSGIIGITYVIFAIFYANLFPGFGLFFPLRNSFLLSILLLLLINPILADPLKTTDEKEASKSPKILHDNLDE